MLIGVARQIYRNNINRFSLPSESKLSKNSSLNRIKCIIKFPGWILSYGIDARGKSLLH